MERCGQMIISNEKLKDEKLESLINRGFAVKVFVNSEGKFVINIFR